MPSRRFFRDIIIGKGQYLPSRSTFKTTMLRGYFALILIISSGTNWTIDEVSGISGNRMVYAGLITTSVITFFLNRRKHYLAVNVILLLICDFAVWLYASAYRTDNAIYVFFLSSSLFALSLFDYKQKAWWISFALLPYGLFLMSRYSDFHLIEKTIFTEIMISRNFVANFSLAYGVSVMLLFFVINMNHHSEGILRKNEESMIFTSEELKKSRLRFELAIKGSNAGVWEWDILNNKVYNSTVWKAMLGYRPDELDLMTVETFLERAHPDDHAKVNGAIDAHMKRQEPYHLEFRMIRRNGTMIWVADSGVALWDENGVPIQMVGSIIDITERKEAEEQIILQNSMLAKTNAELDRFVYSTSHDLRSPLSSLLGLITIAERTDDPQEAAACLGMMKDRIRTMENFIKEIIDYSRNTRLAVKREPVPLFPLINEIVENLRFSEGAENIFVKYNIPPDLNLISDENRLRVVFNNLIGNAFKYHDSERDNPFISIEAKELNERVYLVIEDNGIGIGAQHQTKIFDMFYRASEKSHGSGLGLYIVKETIEKLGGTVSVHSEPGVGTRFSIEFPVHPVREEAETAPD